MMSRRQNSDTSAVHSNFDDFGFRQFLSALRRKVAQDVKQIFSREVNVALGGEAS